MVIVSVCGDVQVPHLADILLHSPGLLSDK